MELGFYLHGVKKPERNPAALGGRWDLYLSPFIYRLIQLEGNYRPPEAPRSSSVPVLIGEAGCVGSVPDWSVRCLYSCAVCVKHQSRRRQADKRAFSVTTSRFKGTVRLRCLHCFSLTLRRFQRPVIPFQRPPVRCREWRGKITMYSLKVHPASLTCVIDNWGREF